jgi:hypothetical protein
LLGRARRYGAEWGSRWWCGDGTDSEPLLSHCVGVCTHMCVSVRAYVCRGARVQVCLHVLLVELAGGRAAAPAWAADEERGSEGAGDDGGIEGTGGRGADQGREAGGGWAALAEWM